LAEVRESPPRPFLSKLRGDGRPGELRKWFTANWPAFFMLFLIFVLALFMRSYFGYPTAADNGYLVSGGSDSYYWERIINYSAHTGKQLYMDPMLNYPEPIRNPRPPFFSMSVVVPAVLAQNLFSTLHDALGWTLLWSTAFWGALTVIPTYFLGKETFGRRAGLAAAFFLAIMPAHIQRSVLSDADHDSFILFFIVLTFYFLLKAVKTQVHRVWVENWRSPASIKSGLRDYFRGSRSSVMYSLMAGVAYSCVIMAWVGFGYATVLILVYYVIQVILNKFKNVDSLSVTIIVTLAMGLGFLLSFPVYYEQTLIPVRFDVPVYLFLASILFGMLFVISRDFPWTLTLPAIGVILVIGIIAINAVDPALAQAILSGQGYFVKNKLYSTIAEARAPRFSELAMGFGVVTFFMSLIGLLWAIIKIPKKTTAEYIFIVVWLGAAIFMAISAGRFMFNAAPAFAISAGWVLVVIVDKLDFNSVRKSLVGASGSYLRIFRKSVKVRHIAGALFLAFMIVLPNVWYGTDAGVPSEIKSQLDRDIYFSLPSFMRPQSYDKLNGSDWYLGAFGYSLPLPKYYFPAAWSWFAHQDSNILPESDRPAYVSWWDYGFEAIEAGKHPTVADNFQNGYQLTGNAIMAQSEDDAIAIFAYRLIQAAVSESPEMKAMVLALFDQYGGSSSRMEHILYGPGQSIIDEVLSDPVVYGPMASDLSDANARIAAGRVELEKLGGDKLVEFYGALSDMTGWSIRYFSVDSRLFPRSGQDTGIFYAPAKLSDRRMIRDSTPIDFYDIKAVDQYGRQYSIENITPDLVIADYKIVYKDMFYKSMFYRAMCGYSGSDLGTTNDAGGVPGVTASQGFVGGSLSSYPPMPGWNMTHFRMVYRTAYYNPYPAEQVPFHRDAWTAVSLEEAAQLKQDIQNGKATGVVDDSAGSFYTAGAVFLEYYAGAFVNGTLTDEQDNPVAGVRVTIQDDYGIPHGTTLTDSNGHYSLLAPFGNVTLTFSTGSAQNIGLVGANVITRMQFNVTDDQAMRRPYDYDSNGIPDYIITKDFKMKGTEVTGDIFWDTNGDGNYTANVDQLIPGATVVAKDLGTNRNYTIYAADGTFDATLPPGKYRFDAQLFDTTMTMAETTNLTPGQKSAQKLAVKPCGLSGTITWPDGRPAAGIGLRMTDIETGFALQALTGVKGNFTFGNIVSGRYNLITTEPGWMLFRAMYDLSSGQSLDVNLTLWGITTVSAKAVVNGLPAAGAVYMLSNVYNPDLVATGMADDWGNINVQVPSGLWSLYVTYFSGYAYYAGMSLLDTSTSSSAYDVVPLSPATLVTGTLRASNFVQAENEFVVFEATNGARVPVRTDSAGSFNIRLPAQSYKVTSTSIANKGILSDTLTITSTPVNFQLRMLTGVLLKGYIWMDHDMVSGISAADLGRYAELKVTDSAGRSFTTMAGPDGAFSAVFPKNSPVVMSLGNPGYTQWSRTATVSADNDTVGILAVPDYVTVTGQATVDGIGVGGVLVSFLPTTPLLEAYHSTTGPNGLYSVTMPPGAYEVFVNQDTNLLGGERYMFAQSTTIDPSAFPVSFNISLQKRVEMHGNVLGAASNIQLKLDGPEVKNLTLTSLNYSVYVLPGTYKIYATGMVGSTHYASMSTAAVTYESREYDIQLVKAYQLSGTITIGSSRVSSPVSVTALSSTGEVLHAQSTSLGTYSFDLPPDQYSLSYVLESTMAQGGNTLYIEYAAQQDVTVERSNVIVDPSLVMRLDNVTLSGTAYGPDGSPQQAFVQLIASSKYGMNASFTTASDGSFSVQVQPGDYTVYAVRLQDKRAALTTLHITRNVPVGLEIDLKDGRYLSSTVRAGSSAVSVDVQVSSGNAKLHVMSDAEGKLVLLVPPGNYTLSAYTSRVEGGLTVAYSGSAGVVVGDYDAYTALNLQRDTKRSVSASWDRRLTQTAPPGVKVTYSFTVTNTGNVDDLFLITFVGTGFDVKFTPSEVTLGYDSGNNSAVIVAEVTASSKQPAGDTKVACLVRSRTLGSARADINLYLNVAGVNGVSVTSTNVSAPVSSLTTVTKFKVNNTGNIDDVYTLQISNLESLASLGWTAEIVDPVTDAIVTQANVSAFGSKDLQINFTATRSNPDPTARAVVLAVSTGNAGVSAYGAVPVILPDLSIGPGDIQVERSDVSYTQNTSYMYVDLALVASLASLFFMFFYLRKKKGLGRSGGAKK
jgi:dolichyl-diphosphooligosaccharide--protein glycosyltransferase